MIRQNLFSKKGVVMLAMVLFCGAICFGSMSTVIAGTVCEGDFDTDGDVDGSDLAVFAADFGRTDCSSNDFIILGSAEFEKGGITDYYDIGITRSDPELGTIWMTIKPDTVFQNILMSGIEGATISKLKLYSGDPVPGEELLWLESLHPLNVYYLPPVQNNDPFLIKLNFAFAIQVGPECSMSQVYLINTVGYPGSIPPPGYENYIPISDFQFNLRSESLGEPLVPEWINIVAEWNTDYETTRFPSCLDEGAVIGSITIVKFGQERGLYGPEARIVLENAKIISWSIVPASSGKLESYFTIKYGHVTWTYWVLENGEWTEYTNIY